jgi:CHAT domain-containing protein/tetratricopeptide (TPR) repeat protein
MKVFSGFLFAVISLANSTLVHAAWPKPSPGVVVEEVSPGSVLERAGLRAGDILASWARLPGPRANQQPAIGIFDSPYAWEWLVAEQAPRGVIRLSGEREGVPFTLEIPLGKWDARVHPWMSAAFLSEYGLGKRDVDAGKLAEGLSHWKHLLDNWPSAASPDLRSWLSLHIAYAYRRHRDWESADTMYKLAEKEARTPLSRAIVLTALGRFNSERERFSDAQQPFQEALATWEANWGRQLGYASILQELAALAWSQGNSDLSDQYALTALEIQAPLAPESLDLGRTYTILGQVSRELGILDRADIYYLQALVIDESLASDKDTANDLNSLGAVAYRRGDLRKADVYFKLAYEIRHRIEPESLDTSETLNNLGSTADSLGSPEAAAIYYQCSFELIQRLAPDSTYAAESLDNLGVLSYRRGELEVAEGFLRRSLKLKERLEPKSVYLARTITNLSAIAIERGDLESAEDLVRRALLLNESFAPGGLDSASCFGNLGVIAYYRGDLDGAATNFRRTLEIQQREAPRSPDLANTLDNLGNIDIERGDFSGAEKYDKRALELRETISPDSLEVAASLESLAVNSYRRGDLDSAERDSRRALAIQERFAPESLAVAASLSNLADVASGRGDMKAARSLLEKALGILGRIPHRGIDEALILHSMAILLKDEQPQLAMLYLQKTVDALEMQAGKLSGSHETKAMFRAKYNSYYRELIDVLVEKVDVAKAFELLERSRAKSLLSMLFERDLAFSRDLPEELERERRQLAIRYDRIQDELSTNGGPNGASQEDLRNRLNEVHEKQEEIALRVRKASPRLGGLQYPQPLGLRDVQKILDSGTIMIAYSVSQKATQLFVVRKDRPLEVRTLRIGEKELTEEVKEFRLLIASGFRHSRPQEARAAGERLYRQLIRPIEGSVGRSRRLLVIPDGPLHILPWAALVRRKTGAERGWQYLVEWKPFHVALSGSLYAELKSRRKKNGNARGTSLVAFGDPVYPASPNAPGEDPYVRSLVERGFVLRPLPATRVEVNRIARFYGTRATKYLGLEATEERAKAIDRSTRYVHFAAHGILDDLFPLNSAIALSIPAAFRDGQENGLLQVWEIFEKVRVDADLVVLSACESGLGKELGGEGLSGLTRAFHYAGARSVLASLWKVWDEGTAELMALFYRNLEEGKSKDEALRAAQMELIRKGDRDASSPFVWAAFEIFGDWR